MSQFDWKLLMSSAPHGSEHVPHGRLLKGLGGVAGPCLCSAFPLCGLWRAVGGNTGVPVHSVIDYRLADLCLDHGNEKGELIEKHLVFTLVSLGKL